MAQALGTHNARLARVCELREKKGRREHGAFAFEGIMLLEEAQRSNLPVSELYVTQEAYDATPLIHDFERQNIPVYVIDDRTFVKISDVETPSGVLAVAPVRFTALTEIVGRPGVALALADLNDPGNAGTLVRSCDAFAASGVIFGDLGVDPYHPKVVRSAMGSLFRVPIALADPAELAGAARAFQVEVFGLDRSGSPLERITETRPAILLVGHERHGLGRWASVCTGLVAIPTPGPAESLNAAVAGSIALHVLTAPKE